MRGAAVRQGPLRCPRRREALLCDVFRRGCHGVAKVKPPMAQSSAVALDAAQVTGQADRIVGARDAEPLGVEEEDVGLRVDADESAFHARVVCAIVVRHTFELRGALARHGRFLQPPSSQYNHSVRPAVHGQRHLSGDRADQIVHLDEHEALSDVELDDESDAAEPPAAGGSTVPREVVLPRLPVEQRVKPHAHRNFHVSDDDVAEHFKAAAVDGTQDFLGAQLSPSSAVDGHSAGGFNPRSPLDKHKEYRAFGL
mmetsp:Transcript_23698/g.79969  ORF Transcript_23698/g.79969 Transcript_23698/m.79969 type:complete len:255 (-) Transcript_23698:2614-3378(-)